MRPRAAPARAGRGAVAVVLFALAAAPPAAAQPAPAGWYPPELLPTLAPPPATPGKTAGEPPASGTPGAAPPAPQEAKGTQDASGPDGRLNVTWDAGGLRLRGADGAFTVHVGGRLMTDEVWWTQS